MRLKIVSTFLVTSVVIAGCATTPPAPDSSAPADTATNDASLGSPMIVLRGGGSLIAVAGDVLHLDVVIVSTAGVQSGLPAGAVVEWTAPMRVIALASGSTPTTSALPHPGLHPTAFFIQNREHYTDAQIAGMLVVTDAGSIGGESITVDAHITGAGLDARVSATIPVGPAPGGDAAHGRTFYASTCASCHGPIGEGGSAPGLNHATGNVASDPMWNAPIFSSVARADMDNLGVSQGPGMPLWLTVPTAAGALVHTQDMIDVYAWLLTQG